LTKSGEFSTAQSLRFISLDGASNVRDIGGWKTESGKTIKYGMLFRGGEIDGGKNTGHPDFRLTKEGIAQLRAFGIKTDLDLRSEDVKVSEFSILGSDVTRTFYDAAQYEAILKPSNAEKIRKIFSTLAKPEAYPVYLHCTHGVDRAGSTTMMLEALLGVAKADLIRDYELSAFYHNYKHVNRELNNGGTLLALIAGLEAYEGETLADKTANFLLSVGVTQAEIDSIRNILLN
jgi:protein-tyrosine phosphatase